MSRYDIMMIMNLTIWWLSQYCGQVGDIKKISRYCMKTVKGKFMILANILLSCVSIGSGPQSMYVTLMCSDERGIKSFGFFFPSAFNSRTWRQWYFGNFNIAILQYCHYGYSPIRYSIVWLSRQNICIWVFMSGYDTCIQLYQSPVKNTTSVEKVTILSRVRQIVMTA